MNIREKTIKELSEIKTVFSVKQAGETFDFYFKYSKITQLIHVKHTSKFKREDGNTVAIDVFSFIYGDMYLVAPIKTFIYALTRAKDLSKKKPKGVWVVKYPYMKLRFIRYSSVKYEIRILDKFQNEDEFTEAIMTEKGERFGE